MKGWVIFSHGKDSHPQATKISAMKPLAEEAGWQTLSVDYRGLDDPRMRVDRLLESVPDNLESLVLMGSSLGGLVSVFGSQQLTCRGLFLLAPAVYWPGYEHLDYTCRADVVEIIHGWRDDVVPVETSVRLAREHNARLHVLDDDHRLIDQLPEIEHLFLRFLERVEQLD